WYLSRQTLLPAGVTNRKRLPLSDSLYAFSFGLAFLQAVSVRGLPFGTWDTPFLGFDSPECTPLSYRCPALQTPVESAAIVQQPSDIVYVIGSYRTWLEAITGGRGGIRTHGTLAGTPVFKTGALNHSATLPLAAHQALGGKNFKNG